jgi:hypothetical protein
MRATLESQAFPHQPNLDFFAHGTERANKIERARRGPPNGSVQRLSGMFLLIPAEFLPPLIAEEVILIEEQDRSAQDH